MNRMITTRIATALAFSFAALAFTAGHAVADPGSVALIVKCVQCPQDALDVIATGSGVGSRVVAKGDQPTPERLAEWARTAGANRVLWVSLDAREARRTDDDWSSHVAIGSGRVVLWYQPDGIIWRETFAPVRSAHIDAARARRAALRDTAERVAKATLDRRALSGQPVNPTRHSMIGGVERLVARADAALAARPSPFADDDELGRSAYDRITALEGEADAAMAEALRHPAASPSRLGPALRRNEHYGASISADRRLWSIGYRAETGGTDDEIHGGYHLWNDDGVLTAVETPEGEYPGIMASENHIADLHFASGTLYLMARPDRTGTYTWQDSAVVTRLGEGGVETFATFDLPDRRYDECDWSLQTPPGGPIQAVPGMAEGVAVIDFAYTVVDASDQAVQAGGGCPPGSKTIAHDEAHLASVCWVKGRQIFDGTEFKRLDTHGVCAEDLPPALMRFCESTR